MMKEAFVDTALNVEIRGTPIPKPGRSSPCLDQDHTQRRNPTDWKVPEWTPDSSPTNSSDDRSGIVYNIGEALVEFEKGDRATAMHQMFQPHGGKRIHGMSSREAWVVLSKV